MPELKTILELQGYRDGGSAVHTADLSNFLQERGFNILLGCPEGSLVVNSLNRAVQVYPVNMGGKRDILSLFVIQKIIKQHHVNLVHTHCRNADLAGLIASFCIPNVKNLVTLHGWMGNKTGKISHGFELNPFIHSIVIRLFADRVIAISEAVKSCAVTKYHLPAEKISVVYNGTNEEQYSLRRKQESRVSLRAELGIAEDSICVIHVANLYPSKRHELFLQSAQMFLRDQSTRGEVFFLIVGAGQQEQVLRKMARDLKIEDRIFFLGFRSDVPRLLMGSDLAVVCSIWEGFGRGVVEAFAAQIPVIAIDVGAIPELMPGELASLIIPCPDPSLIAKKISSLLHDRTSKEKFAYLGRRLYESRFTSNVFAENTLAVIEELLVD